MNLVFLASAAGPAGAGGGLSTYALTQIFMFAAILGVFYFLVIRPQQRRLKAHRDMLAGIKRGDTIVTTGGLIGKVRSVQDDELRVELAPNVEVRVKRSYVSDLVTKGEPAPANDSKPAKSGE